MTGASGPDLLDGSLAAPADERELLRALDLALHMPDCQSLWPTPGKQVRVFDGTAGQVRAVRQFVREQLVGHPATTDAVVVASELATNSIVHSATCQPDGRFLVYATVTRDREAAMIVTDQGGPFRPGGTTIGRVSESGRGLAVVRSLTSLFRICGHANGHRSFIAVIAAGPALGSWSR